MKRFIPFAAALLLASSAAAQQTACSPAGPADDACVKAVDLFNYMAPQLAGSLAGGNAVLGWAGSLGGLGRVSFGVRASGMLGTAPRVTEVVPSPFGAQASTYPTQDQILGLPTADLAVGVTPAFDFGMVRMTGADLLVSAQYLRNINTGSFAVEVPGGSTKLGAGARVGFAAAPLGTIPLPEFGLSYLRRALPVMELHARVNDDELHLRNVAIAATSVRATLGYRFGPFGIVVGGGPDRYRSDGDIAVSVAARSGPPATPTASAQTSASQSISRSTVFADFSLSTRLVHFVAEVGRSSGGRITTFNQFDGPHAAANRTLVSFGLVAAF